MQMMKEVMIVVLIVNLKKSINISKYRFSFLLHFFLAADTVEDAALRLQLFRHVCSSPDMSEAMSADSLHEL